MFSRLPATMAGYATQELAEKLMPLSPAQRAAIARIVQHVFISNLSWSGLFAAPDPICREDNYYRRGQIDPETGHWRRKPGWGHDKEFQDALAEAVRLALQVQTREELAALQTARRRARMAAGAVIGELVSIATGKQIIKGEVVGRNSDDKDRINAGKVLLDYAGGTDDAGTVSGGSEEEDWWKAVDATD